MYIHIYIYIHIHLRYLYLYTFVHANSGSRCFFGGACRPLGSCNLPSPLRWKSWGLCTPRWAETEHPQKPKSAKWHDDLKGRWEGLSNWRSLLWPHYDDVVHFIEGGKLGHLKLWTLEGWRKQISWTISTCVDTFVISITMHQVLQDLRQHVVQWLHRYYCTRLSQICVSCGLHDFMCWHFM